jgi:SMODS-associating 2TM, beta-strand rich effector domain
MYRIIDFLSLIRYASIWTTILSICAYELAHRFWDNDLPLLKILSIAPWVSFFITKIFTTGLVSRRIWKICRWFNKSLFPDLNGTWEGEITTSEGHQISAKAVVRQTLLQTQIDMHTATSKSLSLETTPAVESGQSKIYYVYRSIPRNLNWQPYVGTTIFDIRVVSEGDAKALELSGVYFTDRGTHGRVRLRQVTSDIYADVSFY